MTQGKFTPVEEKAAAGNPGKRRLVPDMDQTKLGDAPAGFNETEREYWDRIATAAYWLKESDRTSVIMLCKALYDSHLARANLRDALVVEDFDRAFVSELNRLLKNSQDRAYQLLSAMGLNPKARASLGDSDSPAEDNIYKLIND